MEFVPDGQDIARNLGDRLDGTMPNEFEVPPNELDAKYVYPKRSDPSKYRINCETYAGREEKQSKSRTNEGTNDRDTRCVNPYHDA